MRPAGNSQELPGTRPRNSQERPGTPTKPVLTRIKNNHEASWKCACYIIFCSRSLVDHLRTQCSLRTTLPALSTPISRQSRAKTGPNRRWFPTLRQVFLARKSPSRETKLRQGLDRVKLHYYKKQASSDNFFLLF